MLIFTPKELVWLDEPVYMVTTTDNPWNPFTNFTEWYTWDCTHGWHLEPGDVVALGYCTSAYLARVSADSPDISPAQSQREINDAIDEIVKYSVTGNHVKVTEDDFKNWIPITNN